MTVPRAPIACSLDADDRVLRGKEWHEFLDRSVAASERRGSGVRLRLKDEAAVLAAIDLSRREKACCSFFEFRLELLPEAVWLEVTAPDEAASALDALLGTQPA